MSKKIVSFKGRISRAGRNRFLRIPDALLDLLESHEGKILRVTIETP
jgi:hypothetical protein